ncbi:hypothetical protein [Leeia sp.]|uniref:hypothetical protein n=1 Tax=Leeia sp. TaxID=2884678 RepID=UPI0035B1BAF6
MVTLADLHACLQSCNDLAQQASHAWLCGMEDALQAQLDGCRALLEDWQAQPLLPAGGPEQQLRQQQQRLSHQLELGMTAARNIYLSNMRTQTEWLQLSEKWVATCSAALLDQLPTPPGSPAPAVEAMRSAVEIGGCAFDSLSKATRQVSHFAGTNMTAATLKALNVAREKLNG